MPSQVGGAPKRGPASVGPVKALLRKIDLTEARTVIDKARAEGADTVDLGIAADTVAATLRDVGATAPLVAGGTVRSAAALAARRDLQLSLLAMVAAYDNGSGGSVRERAAAERLWPTVMAVENLGYRVLAACWSLEHGDGAPPARFSEQIAAEQQRLQKDLVRQSD